MKKKNGFNSKQLTVKWIIIGIYMDNINCFVYYNPKSFIMKNKSGATADIIAASLKETSRLVDIYTVGVMTVLCFYLIIPAKYF